MCVWGGAISGENLEGDMSTTFKGVKCYEEEEGPFSVSQHSRNYREAEQDLWKSLLVPGVTLEQQALYYDGGPGRGFK